MEIVIFIVLVLVIIAANIKVVPQAHAFIIERFGAYSATWNVGIHIKIPFIDKIAGKVNLQLYSIR